MATKAKRKTPVRKPKIVIPDDVDLFTRTSQYTDAMDRHRDFKMLFFGSELGLKVFREILGMGYILNDTTKINQHGVDVNATLIATGERRMAMAMHRTATVQPVLNPPTQQTRRQTK